MDSELKKRVFTRKGAPVPFKLGSDIHAVLSVMEGEDYSVLKNMISMSKRRTMPQAHAPGSSQQSDCSGRIRSNCKCRNNIAVLQDTVSAIQAEMLMLKQSVNASNQLGADQVRSISDTVKHLKTDIQHYAKEIGDLTKHVPTSTCDGVKIRIESMSTTLDHRISSIEKFLDCANIHVVSVASENV